ncbi:MAG: hypothetical protein LBR28_07655 [Bacteroidales bacterium]|jgi:DNA repair exonuclease SbcCD ATPase subunit|nr:hypothetical protein [Bacteroidales bacterium]
MNRKIITLAISLVVAAVLPTMAQKFLNTGYENVYFDYPDTWNQKIETRADNNAYTVFVNDNQSKKNVKVTAYRYATEVETLITNIASQQSLQKGFEYMVIEKVKAGKLAKKSNVKLLGYSNNNLNEAFVGGIYGLNDNGYTYTIEYYLEDNPSDKKLMDKILQSIRIEKPLTKPNIFDLNEKYDKQGEKQAVKDKEKVEKDMKKAKKEQKQAAKDKEKVVKEQKKLEKERKQAEKEQEEMEKAKKKAAKEQAKREEEHKKELKKQKQEAKKALEEQEKQIKEKQKKIEEQEKAEKEQEKAAKKAEKEKEKALKAQRKEIKEQIKTLEKSLDAPENKNKEAQKLIKEQIKKLEKKAKSLK